MNREREEGGAGQRRPARLDCRPDMTLPPPTTVRVVSLYPLPPLLATVGNSGKKVDKRGRADGNVAAAIVIGGVCLPHLIMMGPRAVGFRSGEVSF